MFVLWDGWWFDFLFGLDFLFIDCIEGIYKVLDCIFCGFFDWNLFGWGCWSWFGVVYVIVDIVRRWKLWWVGIYGFVCSCWSLFFIYWWMWIRNGGEVGWELCCWWCIEKGVFFWLCFVGFCVLLFLFL